MDAAEKARRRAALEKALGERGLPVTVQRRAIFDVVLEHGSHPTVDEIFARVQRRLPGVSRATVHRTLETFSDLGILAKAPLPGRATRYDTLLERHHHAICDRCEAILDLRDMSLTELPLPDTAALGFEARDVVVQVRGLCRSCRGREPRRKPPSVEPSARRTRR